jgi:hypothetical protein
LSDLAAVDPKPNGRTVFENPDSRHPFDGDYILQIRDGNRFIRARFIVDRQARRITVVAIVRLPLMM